MWGATLRSPHPYARITGIDITEALKLPGVYAVLTHEDVPGANLYGLEHSDQPVLAVDVVRYQGEPVALVAADHPETARRAIKRIKVDYDVLDAGHRRRERPSPARARRCTRAATSSATSRSDAATQRRHGRRRRLRRVRGRHAGPGVPRPGVRARRAAPRTAASTCTSRRSGCTSTSADRRRARPARRQGAADPRPASAARSAAARTSRCRSTRACSRCTRGKPVKMVYNREESFFGHVHRHPAKMYYEHGATRDGQARLRQGADVPRRRRVRVHDRRGRGERRHARRRTRTTVANVTHRLLGHLHEQPAVRRDARLRRGAGRRSPTSRKWTSWPPRCGMRPGRDPRPQRHERGRHHADRPGRRLRRSRRGTAGPGACQADTRRRDRPIRPPRNARRRLQHDPRRGRRPRRRLRGRRSRTSASPRASTTTRPPACGWRSSAASRRRRCTPRPPRSARAWSRIAAADRPHRAGRATQVTVHSDGHLGRQRRLDLGVPPDLRHRRRGAGRLRGGAGAASSRPRSVPRGERSLVGGKIVAADGGVARRPGRRARRRRRSRRPSSGGTGRPTRWTRRPARATRTSSTASPRTGRSSTWTPNSAWSRWSQLDCAQDVGKAMNPQAVVGQIQGGSAQGLGLAVMEEIQIVGRQGPQPLLHRLPDPDHPRHAADAHRRPGTPRPARARTACAASASRRRSRRPRPSSPRSAPRPAWRCPRPGPARTHHRNLR